MTAGTEDAQAPGPRHSEARRLLAKGFKLVELHAMSKQPAGDGWNLHPIRAVRDEAGGYGMLLAANALCSIDPDNVEPAREGLARCGFDLDQIMHCGVRTLSTRPGSGGRSTFRAPDGVRWIRFASKRHGTILELRANSPNLQDCLPGTVYRSAQGDGPFEQAYANGKRLDEAPGLPPDFIAWWQRLSNDLAFLREQQAILCGQGAMLDISGGDSKALAFSSQCRVQYNEAHDVPGILARHAYVESVDGRWAPPTATGSPAVRAIPGKDGLWQSDHASDPLRGTFDAWTAHVVLDHDSEQAAAEAAFAAELARSLDGCFEKIPEPVGDELAEQQAIRERNSKLGVGAPASRPAGAIQIRPFREMLAGRVRAGYFVKRVLPKGEIALVFGASGAGKSFFVLHLIACIAMGRQFFDKKVRQARVVYGCFEGLTGALDRFDAYERHYGVELGGALQILTGPVRLTSDESTAELISAVRAVGDVGLLVIDTLARVTPGTDENAGKDMSPVLDRAQRVHEATGAMVLLVHHSGKDSSKGARGWSGVKAPLDVEIEVLKLPKGRAATITKMKDGEGEGDSYGFDIENIVLGQDDEGDDIGAGVFVEGGAGVRLPTQQKALGPLQLLLLRQHATLAKIGDLGGVPITDLLEAVASQLPEPGLNEKGKPKRDTRAQRVRESLEGLLDAGHLVSDGTSVRVPEEDDL